MKIAVLGTGVVGKVIAEKLDSLGHEVSLGTRDPAATKGRNTPGQAGEPSFAEWLAAHPKISVCTYADAAAASDLVMHATSGGVALEVLARAGAPNLAGKILVDISNPLDFSKGFPPRLWVANDDSLGEQIQRALPDVKVVKTLNTVSAPLMVDPKKLADGYHTMFLCGNDADAKARVRALLIDELGWTDVLDLGDITNARGLEMYLPLWTRIYGATKTGHFSIKVVR